MREIIFRKIENSVLRNTSAKAAMDMALYDCIAKQAKLPLYQFIGGVQESIETDYTVSVNTPEEMARDAKNIVKMDFPF